jgi:hypothetical protein
VPVTLQGSGQDFEAVAAQRQQAMETAS